MNEFDSRLYPNGEHGAPDSSSMVDILKKNAENSNVQGIKDVLKLRQAAELSGEKKVNVDVPGFTHIDSTLEQLKRFEDPDTDEVRITSVILQTTTEPQPDFPGGFPTNGPLPVEHDEVQSRLAHVYALLGAELPHQAEIGEDTLLDQLISKTNLGPNIYAIQERGKASVAVRIIRTDKDPEHHLRTFPILG